MMLDPVTGLDPPGVKVRAAEGIEAASSFIQGYWLWCESLIPNRIRKAHCLRMIGRRLSKTLLL
jgi:hypothetical protein